MCSVTCVGVAFYHRRRGEGRSKTRPAVLRDGWYRVACYGRKMHLKHTPTVSLDVISLAASSCGYDRGHIEQRAAHEFTVHVATQRGLAKRLQYRPPPRAQPVAPMRERPCRRPRLTPRRCTAQAPSRDQRQPGGAHGRRNDPIASQCLVMRCPPVSPLFASWQWLLRTGCSLEAIDMTVH